MPLDFASFDATVNSAIKLRKVCKDIGISESKCNSLMEVIGDVCSDFCGSPRAAKKKTKRTLSRWQHCIIEGRTGKKFDPQAIKELSKLYKEGKCPSKEYMERLSNV